MKAHRLLLGFAVAAAVGGSAHAYAAECNTTTCDEQTCSSTLACTTTSGSNSTCGDYISNLVSNGGGTCFNIDSTTYGANCPNGGASVPEYAWSYGVGGYFYSVPWPVGAQDPCFGIAKNFKVVATCGLKTVTSILPPEAANHRVWLDWECTARYTN